MTMSQKVGAVLATLAVGVVVILVLMAMSPATRSLVTTANTSLQSSANMTNFAGTAELVGIWPYLQWFVVPVLIVLAIVLILRAPQK